MKYRTAGSALMVAGTTIGAGMLAMPLVTAGIGFTVTLALLVLLWLLMCYTALLLVEVWQHQQGDVGLGTLAKRYLGQGGLWLTSCSMLFLMYALTAAYISGAGEWLSAGVNDFTQQSCPLWFSILVFTLVAGGMVCAGMRFIDVSNRILLGIKLVFLILASGLMMPHIEKTHLMTLPLEKGLVLSAIPVIFTSFGFHGSIPGIINYLEGNTHKLRWVFIIGSAIPLGAYILWQRSMLGSLSSETFAGIFTAQSGLEGLLQAVNDILSSRYMALTVHLFASLALVTSFLGVSRGLFDYLADLCKRQNTLQGRWQTGLLTFLPPLTIALLYPQGFVMALGFAGVALAILALFLPALMVWKARALHQRQYQVWGGKPMLILVLICGVMVIAIQAGIVLDLLPQR